MNHLHAVRPLKQTMSGAASSSRSRATGAHLRKSAALNSDALRLGRFTTSVNPMPRSTSHASSPGPSSLSTPANPERLSAAQKRFRGVAKYFPTDAEYAPGLIPTNTRSSPGRR